MEKKGYYNTIAPGYNELHGAEQLAKLRIIKEILNPKKSDKLLDVGCGTGLSGMLGCDITGIDPAAELLKRADIKVVKGFVEKLPFKDRQFDAVICVTAVHNFTDPKKAIEEMKRVSKKGGRIVISLLKKAKAFERLRALIEAELKIKTEIDESTDIIFFCSHKI